MELPEKKTSVPFPDSKNKGHAPAAAKKPLSLRILAGTSFVLAQTGITLLLNMVTIILLAQKMSLTDFGILMILFSFLAFFVKFFELGIGRLLVSDTSTLRASNKLPDAMRLLNGFMNLQLFLGIVSSLFLIAVSKFTGFSLGGDIVFLCMLLIIESIKTGFTVYLNSFEFFKRQSFFLIIESVLTLLLVAVSLFFFQMTSPNLMLLAYIIAHAAAIIIILPFSTAFLAPKFSSASNLSQLMKIIAGHGKYVVGTNMLKVFESVAPVWFISLIVGPVGVALYSTATKLQLFFIRILDPLNQILMPVFGSIVDEQSLLRVYSRTSKYLVLSSVALLLLGFLSSFFIPTILGDKYTGAIPTFLIQLLIVPIFAINIGNLSIFYRKKEQKKIFFITLVTDIIFAVLCPLLTYYFSIIGTAVAVLFFVSFDTVLKLYFLSKMNYTVSALWKIDDEDRRIFRTIFNSILRFFRRDRIV